MSANKMSSMEEFVSNATNICVLRKILFAVVFLPEDMPNYWETVRTFAKADLTVNQLQSVVQNLQYLNKSAFLTDRQLISTMCATSDSIGIILVSANKKCQICHSAY